MNKDAPPEEKLETTLRPHCSQESRLSCLSPCQIKTCPKSSQVKSSQSIKTSQVHTLSATFSEASRRASAEIMRVYNFVYFALLALPSATFKVAVVEYTAVSPCGAGSCGKQQRESSCADYA